MQKIIFLGTGSSVTSKVRDTTATLLISGKEKILIDVPGSLLVKLSKLNIDYRKISNIFITHTHPDHIYGLIAFLHARYNLKDKINIFSHQKTLSLIKTLRAVFNLNNKAKFPEVKYFPLRPNRKLPFYKSKDLKAWSFNVNHATESLGFKFLLKDKSTTCIFSGDTSYSANLIRWSKNCKVLIHDCFAPLCFFKRYPPLNKMHTSSLLLGKIAYEINPKVLVPIHFSGEFKYSINTIPKEIKKNFQGKVIMPSDLQELRLPRNF